MLKTKLLHPQMLEALGRAGHGSQVLIADGNFPFATTLGANARLVSLNVMPGLITATQALDAVLAAVPIEAAAVMQTLKSGPYAMTEDPPIWAEFRKRLHGENDGIQLDEIERFAFYDAARSPMVALTIATGEQRIYANLLLTIGVVMPG